MEPDLLPGRSCGECNVCCVALTIDDPALQKPQGYRCRNSLPDHGCAIYNDRPQTCRTFFCGWRQFKWVKEKLRPDRSGVLIRMHSRETTDGKRIGIVFMLLDRASLRAEGLAESIAAAIAAEIEVYINVPGPPRYTIGRLNDALRNAVLTGDKPEMLKILRNAWNAGRSGDFKPIKLKPRGPDAAKT
jgi:Fe-S-cluster containining protein